MNSAGKDTPIVGTQVDGARMHQWHIGMDAVYAVGSQWYAHRPAPAGDVVRACQILRLDLVRALAGDVSDWGPSEVRELVALVALLDGKILDAGGV